MSHRSRERRQRRKRRQSRQALKHGPSAKPSHRSPSGRTGMVHQKKTPSSKRANLSRTYTWQRLNGRLTLVPDDSE